MNHPDKIAQGSSPLAVLACLLLLLLPKGFRFIKTKPSHSGASPSYRLEALRFLSKPERAAIVRSF